MNRLTQSRRMLRQRGTAAVEMALLSFVMAGILMAPIMIAHSLMQVTVAQRASFNAAHMLATYHQYQRLDPSLHLLDEAKSMMLDELDGAALAAPTSDAINAYCSNSANCQQPTVPTEIAITLPLDVLAPAATDFSTVRISLTASDRYAN